MVLMRSMRWLNNISDTVITSYDQASNEAIFANMNAQPDTAKPFKLSENGDLVVPAVAYTSIDTLRNNKGRLSENAAKETKAVELPAPYFEAKPMRSVDLSEVRAAIIPSDLSAELRTALEQAGIPTVEYQAGDMQSRKQALESVEDVKLYLPMTQKSPAAESGAQYSLPNIADITPSIEQLSDNAKEVLEMECVHKIPKEYLMNSGKEIKDIYNEYFSSWGNNIHSDIFGDVAARRSSIGSEFAHGNTAKKIATIEAIPSVIKFGKIIDWFEKHKGLFRVTVAVPIEIGDTRYYMGVMLQRDSQNQHLYIHDVVIEEEVIDSTQEHLSTKGPYDGNKNLSISSIIKNALLVNNQSMQERTNYGEEEKESSNSVTDAVFEEYKNGDAEAFAAVEFDASFGKENIEEGYGDTRFHTVVTLLEPDTMRNGIPFDYLVDEILSNPDNIEIEIVREPPTRSANRKIHPNTSSESLSNDSIPDSSEKATPMLTNAKLNQLAMDMLESKHGLEDVVAKVGRSEAVLPHEMRALQMAERGLTPGAASGRMIFVTFS